MEFDRRPQELSHIGPVSACLKLSRLLASSQRQEHAEYLQRAQSEAQSFTAGFKDPEAKLKEPFGAKLLSAPQAEIIDRWLETAEGKGFVQALTDDVLTLVKSGVREGRPGHDERHVLLKDPIAAIRMCVQDGITDHRSLFVIAALLHDIGRLPEPVIDEKPESGVMAKNHPQYGFLVLKELLDEHIAPRPFPESLRGALSALKGELLNAVLDHQTGNSRTSFFAQAVQRADREQLVGAEMALRSLAFDVGIQKLSLETPILPERNTTLPLPGTEGDRHYLHHIEFYMRNLFPNIGLGGGARAEKLKVISGIFMRLAASREQQEQFFHPELVRDRAGTQAATTFKGILTPGTWEQIKAGPDSKMRMDMELLKAGQSAQDLALRLLHVPYAAVTPEVEENVLAAVRALTPDAHERYRDAFAYAILTLQGQDLEDSTLLRGVRDSLKNRSELPQYRIAAALEEMI